MDLVVGCYYLNHTRVNYTDAQNNCLEMNGHLVFITSAEEQAALEPYLEGTGEFCKRNLLIL